MALKDHFKSGLAGIAFASGLTTAAGLICVGMGVIGGAAGMAAFGMPLLVGGGCLWAGNAALTWATGARFRQGDQVKHLTFFAGAALTAYCILGNFAPTQNSVPYRNQVFGNKGALTQRFHHAVREVNKHIIWPDMGVKPAHQRPPDP